MKKPLLIKTLKLKNYKTNSKKNLNSSETGQALSIEKQIVKLKTKAVDGVVVPEDLTAIFKEEKEALENFCKIYSEEIAPKGIGNIRSFNLFGKTAKNKYDFRKEYDGFHFNFEEFIWNAEPEELKKINEIYLQVHKALSNLHKSVSDVKDLSEKLKNEKEALFQKFLSKTSPTGETKNLNLYNKLKKDMDFYNETLKNFNETWNDYKGKIGRLEAALKKERISVKKERKDLTMEVLNLEDHISSLLYTLKKDTPRVFWTDHYINKELNLTNQYKRNNSKNFITKNDGSTSDKIYSRINIIDGELIQVNNKGVEINITYRSPKNIMLQDKSALEKYKPHLFIEIKRENIDAEDLNDIVNYVEKLSQNTGCQGRILLKDKQKNKTATLLTKDYNFKPLEGESNLFYLSTDGIKK